MPDKISDEILNRMSKKNPGGISDTLSKRIIMSNKVPERVSDRISKKHMYIYISNRMLGRMP